MSTEMEIGVDQASDKDETVVNVEGGCVRCHRSWPQVTFRQIAAKIPEFSGQMDRSEIVCDSCLASEGREGQIAEAVDEAQMSAASALVRQVMVTGIESKTNVIGFQYSTHVKGVALVITDLLVTFKNGAKYLYSSVPVVVCEAWYAAPSKGSYFAEQIRNSYPCEKIK